MTDSTPKSHSPTPSILGKFLNEAFGPRMHRDNRIIEINEQDEERCIIIKAKGWDGYIVILATNKGWKIEKMTGQFLEYDRSTNRISQTIEKMSKGEKQ